MKIRMLCGYAGVEFSLSPGDETERFSEAEAIRMIAAGFAVPAAPRIEIAVAAPAIETRVAAHAPRKAKRGKNK